MLPTWYDWDLTEVVDLVELDPPVIPIGLIDAVHVSLEYLVVAFEDIHAQSG